MSRLSRRASHIKKIKQVQPGERPQSIHRTDQLEQLWDDLLSRQPDAIRAAFASIDPDMQRSILIHLQNMVTLPGWQPEQCDSAKVALQALSAQTRQEE